MNGGKRLCFVLLGCVTLAALLLSGNVASAESNGSWVAADREQALERLFLLEAYPQIQAGVAASYGYDIPFDSERVVSLQQDSRPPEILRVIVEVHTFTGAHNAVGVDRLEFRWQPGGLRLRGVKHKAYPDSF
ncbi:MAG: DUF3888 domain-containing protein [Mycobacterium leprae]